MTTTLRNSQFGAIALRPLGSRHHMGFGCCPCAKLGVGRRLSGVGFRRGMGNGSVIPTPAPATQPSIAIPGQTWSYYLTPNAIYNALIGGPANSLGLVSTPLAQNQLDALAAQESATIQQGQLGVPLTAEQLAQVQSDVMAGAAIKPDILDLSGLTRIVPSAGSFNWILILLLLGGGGIVLYKVLT
ncbi:MAG: hypothetical protein WB780_20375 [Candidatus Acidiferrales bacterium]